MKNKILKTIENNSPILYSEIETKAAKHGLVGNELDELMYVVQKDKRVISTTKGDDIIYKWVTPVVKSPHSHLTWVRKNYPRMTPENDGSGLEADYSYLFLSPEEMKQYRADAKGMPLYMLKSKYGKGRKQNPA